MQKWKIFSSYFHFPFYTTKFHEFLSLLHAVDDIKLRHYFFHSKCVEITAKFPLSSPNLLNWSRKVENFHYALLSIERLSWNLECEWTGNACEKNSSLSPFFTSFAQKFSSFLCQSIFPILFSLMRFRLRSSKILIFFQCVLPMWHAVEYS